MSFKGVPSGRAFQIVLVVSTLALSWLGMMVVHEFGHVLFAWRSGGGVARVVLSPLKFSRTELQKNHFGLGRAGGAVQRGAAMATFACLLVLIVVEWLTYSG